MKVLADFGGDVFSFLSFPDFVLICAMSTGVRVPILGTFLFLCQGWETTNPIGRVTHV
jgi:hypothetical protein